MTLYLRDATFIDWRTLEISRTDLRVEQGPRGGVTQIDGTPDTEPAIDCHGRIVTRAMAIGHHHIYSTLARGMPPPRRRPTSFVEILELIWWHLDKRLDGPMIRASARACALEAARCGTTFIIDHHASPGAPEGSLGIIREALEEIGVGHLLCYELSERDGPDALERGIAETERHLGESHGLVGLHASFTVSRELLERAVDIGRHHSCGVHIHVAEAPSDEQACHDANGCSVAAWLQRAGALDLPGTLLAHCLHVDSEERAIIRESGAWVVHNTQSNQNNAVGAFSDAGLGDRIMIGTDGMHSDMLASTRAAYLEAAATGRGLSPLQLWQRLRRVHAYLEELDVPGDGENNLVMLSYRPPTPVTSDNWPAHVVYALGAADVHTVISDGRVIVDGGRHAWIDEEEVLRDAQQQAERLWRLL